MPSVQKEGNMIKVFRLANNVAKINKRKANWLRDELVLSRRLISKLWSLLKI